MGSIESPADTLAAKVDAVLAKLAVRYGAAFSRQYADLRPELVRADWTEALGGLTTAQVRTAIENLPADRPPNAGQFRRIAMENTPGPEREVYRALPAPVVPCPPHIRDRLQRVKADVMARHGEPDDQQPEPARTRFADIPPLPTERQRLACDPRFAAWEAGAQEQA